MNILAFFHYFYSPKENKFSIKTVLEVSEVLYQGCGIAMPDSPDSYIEPAGQVDFPG